MAFEDMRTFVSRVGRQLGRAHNEVVPFADVLVENWYDSPASLVDVTPDDLAKLGLPMRFAKELTTAAAEYKNKGTGKGHGTSGKGTSTWDAKGKGKGFDAKGKGKAFEDKGKGFGKGKKGPPQELKTTIPLTDLLHAHPSFDLRTKLLGDGNQNVRHILDSTGAQVLLIGSGGGIRDAAGSSEPLHLQVRSQTKDGLNKAIEFVNDLISVVLEQYSNFERSSFGKAGKGGKGYKGKGDDFGRKGGSKGKGKDKGKWSGGGRDRWHGPY